MAVSLTETVCFAVATAGDLPTLIGDWPEPWPASAIDLLRASVEGLDRDIKASNSLVERAAEFRGHYATVPEPIAGHSAASYHELGRNLAMDVFRGVFKAAGLYFLDKPDFDRVLGNLPAVGRYLQEEAPRFDWQLLVARIRDEGAKAEQRAAPPSPEPPTLLDRLADGLTPQGYKIAAYLWDQPSGASYDTLADVPKAFRGGPTDEAIEKALKRIGDYFNLHLDLGLSISIFSAKRRAKLNRSSDNPGDK